MQATEILRKEHEAILRMLDVTDAVAAQLEEGRPVEPQTLDGLLEFFQLFADRCHHGKEEDLLFPLLEKKGIPREGGPVGVMLMEHEMGRNYVGDMKAAAEDYATGTRTAGLTWAAAARSYTQLLRLHISKENNVLFPMAERAMSAQEQSAMGAAFDRIEVEKMGQGTHERLHALMDELSAKVLELQAR